MIFLALDTSTPAVTAAVVEVLSEGAPPVLLSEHVEVGARAHAERLAPCVRMALEDSGVGPRSVGAVVVGRGPGPYTGLRVGLATAGGISEALGVPTYGVCSLDALGPADSPGRYAVVTDARRREVYWASYESDGSRVTDAAVMRPADLADRLTELSVVSLVGAGAELYRDLLGLAVGPPDYPVATRLVARALERIGDAAPSEAVRPMYLRRPDVRAPGPRKSVLPRR